LKAVVTSTVPIGSGVSSSAALEMAFGVVWRSLADLDIANPELARLGQLCENRFVGVNSGIMDQMASAMGRDGAAMFLDTRTLHIEYAPVPRDLAIVLCDTLKPRALTASAYNERRSQCEEAARIMGVSALRDADLDTLSAAKDSLGELAYRRARHVISENERCVQFKQALASEDRERIYRLMRDSHESLKEDYEVSCPELDAMAESAWGAYGCVGARMTGAGFGGACVALVESAKLDAFVSELLSAYDRRTGLGGEAMPCKPVRGAHVI
jgi:galactokinase